METEKVLHLFSVNLGKVLLMPRYALNTVTVCHHSNVGFYVKTQVQKSWDTVQTVNIKGMQ